MKPENANPKNFKVEKVIYNQDNFAIAIGVWQDDQTRRFAMRWNGGDDDAGYPSVFANPMWFQLPQDIKGVLESIVSNSKPMTL